MAENPAGVEATGLGVGCCSKWGTSIGGRGWNQAALGPRGGPFGGTGNAVRAAEGQQRAVATSRSGLSTTSAWRPTSKTPLSNRTRPSLSKILDSRQRARRRPVSCSTTTAPGASSASRPTPALTATTLSTVAAATTAERAGRACRARRRRRGFGVGPGTLAVRAAHSELLED